MVAIVSGNGLGLFNTSLGTLGANGSFGNAGTGRSGETVFVNAATGNLVLQRQDELLVSQGQDVGVVRTYNSLGKRTDDNGDNWQLGVHKRLFGLTGPVNTANSKITRTDGDGVELVYTYDAASGRYFNRDGGARDALVYNSTTSKWTWTDGDTLVQETYDWNGSAGRILTEGEFGSTVLSTYKYTGALLTSIVDGSGETVFFDYTGNNLMKVRTVKTDGTVTRVQYNYDDKNRLTSVTVDLTPADNNIADGKVYKTTYTYDGDSARVASMTQTDGTTVAFDYEAQSDGSTRIKRVRQTMDDGSVRTTTFTYDLAQRQTTVSDALGNATVYTYDPAGQLLNVKGPAVGDGLPDNGVSFTYDAGGNLEKVINSRGAPIAYASLTYSYDAAGNRINEQDQAFNPILGRTYSASNRLLSETTSIVSQSSGLTTQVQAKTYYVYDASDRLAFRIAPEGLVTEYRYTEQSRDASSIITYAGASFDLSTIAADTQPTLEKLTAWSTNASLDKTRNLRTDIVRDFRGQISTSTAYTKLDTTGKGVADGSESTTLYVYDQAGQLLKTVTPRGTATTATNDFERTFTYDGLGRLLVQTDTLGQVTSNEYDDAGRSITTKMANGLVTTSVYDKAGELVSVTKSANGTLFGTTLHQYDAAGNLRMTHDPIGNRYFYLYDAKGRKTAEIDANGSVAEFRYTEDDLLIQSTRYATALTPAQMAKLLDANGKVTSIGVADLGLVKSADDRSVYHTYRGDINVVTGKRLLDQTIDELGYVTQHRYDTAGRLLTQTRLVTQFTGTPPANGNLVNVKSDAAKDRATRYFYDNEGRLTGTLDAEGYLVERKYDVAGRLALTIAYTKVSASAKWASGTLAELRTSTGTDGVRTRYFYDNHSRLAAEVDGLGYLTKYAYDRDGNRVQQTRHANKIKLDVTTLTEKSKLEEILFDTHADDQVTSWTYTDAGQVATQTNPENTVTRYTYDKVGNLTKTETAYNTLDVRAHQVRYDELGRVTGELGGEGSAELIKLAASVAPAVPTKAQIDAVWAKYGTSHAYDAAGRKVRTTDANGYSTYFYYDADNRLKYTINPLGEVVEHSYTIFGENDGKTAYATPLSPAIKAGLTGGAATAISAAVTALINAAVDAKTSATFSKRGEVLTRTDELLNKQTMTYNAFGDLATLRSPVGASGELVTTYEVDRRGLRKKTIEDATGINRITSAIYDAFGRMTSSVDGNQVTSTIKYDARGRTTTTDGPLRGAGSMTYDAFDRVLTQTDANGSVTRFVHDTSARSVTIETPAGITTVTTRNAHGETVEVKDALDHKTLYEYDKDGNLKTTTDALTQTQKKIYDGANRLIETYDANNVKTVYAYDPANKLMTVTVDPDGIKRATSYTYNSKDRTVDVTDANGVVTRTVYDRKGQVKDVIVDPAGLALKTSYTYDAQGRTLTVTEGVGTLKESKTEYSFDVLGRRSSQVVDVGGLNLKTSYTYDKVDNVVSRTEGVGSVQERTTWYTYDNDRRLVFTIDALGNVSRVFYDKAGRVIQTIAYATAITPQTTAPTTAAIETLMSSKTSAQDRITRHAYDKDGRERFTIDPMGAVVEHKYNEVGNRVTSIAYANRLQGTLPAGATPTVIAAGAAAPAAPAPYVRRHADDRTTTYGYDAVNRRISQSTSAASSETRTESWDYDKVGNVVSHTNGRGATEWFSYDAANRLKRHIDAAGYLTERTYETNSAKVTEKRFATPGTLPATKDAFWAAKVSLPGAKPEDRSTISEYDKAGRLQTVTAPNGAVTRHVYDAVGNLIETTQAYGTDHATTLKHEYDKARRLEKVTTADTAVTKYLYDAVGNLTDTIQALGTTFESTVRREYDKIGRLKLETRAYGTQDATATSYSYDKLLNQTSIITAFGTPAASTMIERFDLAGRKTHVFQLLDIGEAVTETTYNAFGDIATVKDPLGKIGYFYTNAFGQVTLQVDPLGSVTETKYDGAGAVLETIRYASRLVGTPSAGIRPQVLDNASGGSVYVLRAAASDQRQKAILDKLGQKEEIRTWYGAEETKFYSEKFTYDAFGNVQTSTARNGATTVYEYDKANNKALETLPVTSANGAKLVNKFEYDKLGNLKKRTEALGLPEQRITEFEYDKLNRLRKETGEAVSVFDPDTGTTSTLTPVKERLYDIAGRLIEEKDVRGGRTLHYYDKLGREVGTVDAGGAYTACTYDAAGNKTSETRYANAVVVKPSAAIPTDVHPTPLAAPPTVGVFVLIDGLRDRTTHFEHDDAGRVVTTRVDDVTVGEYVLTDPPQADPFKTVEHASIYTRNTYDLAGNLVKKLDGRNKVTRLYYDKAGNLAGQLDAGGYLTVWTRDAFGNVTSQAQYAKPLKKAADDAASLGDLLGSVYLDPSTEDRFTDYEYDQLNRNRLETRRGVEFGSVSAGGELGGGTALSTTRTDYEYDRDNWTELVTRTDANQRTTATKYDALGRKLSEAGAEFKDYNGLFVRERKEYVYNGLNQVAREIQHGVDINSEADARVTIYDYGKNGYRIGQNGPTGKFEFGVDVAGNVTSKALVGQVDVDGAAVQNVTHYWYDHAGRETKHRDVGTDTTEETRYNVFGDITGKRTNGAGAGVEWAQFADYDKLGNAWRTNIGDGVVKMYVYDANGNATFQIDNATIDLRTVSLSDALRRDDNNQTGSLYDARNLLIRTIQPKMNTRRSIVEIRQSVNQGQSPTFTGGNATQDPEGKSLGIDYKPPMTGSVTAYVPQNATVSTKSQYESVWDDGVTDGWDGKLGPKHYFLSAKHTFNFALPATAYGSGPVRIQISIPGNGWLEGVTYSVDRPFDKIGTIEIDEMSTGATFETRGGSIYREAVITILQDVGSSRFEEIGVIRNTVTGIFGSGMFEKALEGKVGPRAIDITGVDTTVQTMFYMKRPRGSAQGWQIHEMRKVADGRFDLSTAGWPDNDYEYRFFGLDAVGKVIDHQENTVSLNRGGAFREGSAGTAFMSNYGHLHLTQLGERTNLVTVYTRRRGDSLWKETIKDAKPNIYGRLINGNFYFDPAALGMSGTYEYLVESHNGDAVPKRSFGSFTVGDPNSVSLMEFYDPPSKLRIQQPRDSFKMTIEYRLEGSTGAYISFDAPRTGESTFDWNTSTIFQSLTTNQSYEFKYETRNALGVLVNRAHGTLVLGPTPSFTQVNDAAPTVLSFKEPAGNEAMANATEMVLSYVIQGSREHGTVTLKRINGFFQWDASAFIAPGKAGAVDYSYTLLSGGTEVKSPSGSVIKVAGTLNVGPAATGAELEWVHAGTETADVLVHRIQKYNAFGEVVAEIDGKGHETTLTYNALGKLIKKEEATAWITHANGFKERARPTTNYYYDLTGRLVATRDANGNLTRQILLGDSERVLKQFNADGGVRENGYDVFGDIRFTQDEEKRKTEYTYDKASRLKRIDRPSYLNGVRGYDSYEYDAAGNRISHTTTTGTVTLVDKTYFDSLGRIRKTVTPMGFESAYAYRWDARIKSVGGVATGGWEKTTTDATKRTMVDQIDAFNRTTKHTDLGGRIFDYFYNHAGWLKSQMGSTGQNIVYDHYANGYVKSISDEAEGSLTRYAYDVLGNRDYEAYSRGQDYFQNSKIEYDENNRVIQVKDTRADIKYEYDAMGNRIRVWSYYHDGVDGAVKLQEYWYAYDKMNRFTVTMGQLSGGRAASKEDTTVKVDEGGVGSDGVRIGYNKAGERTWTITARDQHREDYLYTKGGYLEKTTFSLGEYVGTNTYTVRTNDLLGRVDKYEEFKNGSSTLVRSTTYDKDSRQLMQTGSAGTVKYYYYTEKTDDTSRVAQNGAGMQARVEVVSSNTTTNTWTKYSYWDEAKQENVTLSAWSSLTTVDNAKWKPGMSQFEYDRNGHLKFARDFGEDPAPGKTTDDRTFRYVNNAQGMVLKRETLYWDPGTQTQQFRYHLYLYANNAAVGDRGDDGDERLDYAQMLATKQESREKMYRFQTPILTADFDQNYQPINRDYPGPVSSSYVARTGDTLYSIAASIWGDSSMWYLIADANGLTAEADLLAGQVIRIPNKVTNIHNNNSTMRPYSAGEHMGDTSPTLMDAPLAPIPPPQKSGKKCGVLAKIVVAVVVVVATIYTAGVASGAAGGFSATMSAGATALQSGSLLAAAVGGAVGNAAGQLAGMALGIQDKFNWGGVATGALTSMAGSGMASMNVGSSFASAVNATGPAATYIGAAANAISGSVVNQGLGMLTGQQKSFSWSSVAASGIAAPMTNYVHDGLFGKSGALAGTWAADGGIAGTLAQNGIKTVVAATSRLVVTGGRMSWTNVAADTITASVGSWAAERTHASAAPVRNEEGFKNWRMQKEIKLAIAKEDSTYLNMAGVRHYLDDRPWSQGADVDSVFDSVALPGLPELETVKLLSGAMMGDSGPEILAPWSMHRSRPFGFDPASAPNQPLGALGHTVGKRLTPQQELAYDRAEYYGNMADRYGLPRGLGEALAPGVATQQAKQMLDGGISVLSAIYGAVRTAGGMYFGDKDSWDRGFRAANKLNTAVSGLTVNKVVDGASKGIINLSSVGFLGAMSDRKPYAAGQIATGLFFQGAGTAAAQISRGGIFAVESNGAIEIPAWTVAENGAYSSKAAQIVNTEVGPRITAGDVLSKLAARPNFAASEYLKSVGSRPPIDYYCTEVAANMLNVAAGEGKIVIFGSRNMSWPARNDFAMGGDNLIVPVRGGAEYFGHHSVFTDGKYFYDPLLSSSPVSQSNYLKQLNSLNPNGVSWRLYDPENFGSLKKGGF